MKNPNKVALLVLCLFTLNNLFAQEQSLLPQKTIITGQITNLEKYSNKIWIEFSVPNLFNLKYPWEQIEINSDGSFRYEFDMLSPSCCEAQYSKCIYFVISPGDSLHFSIDAKIWGDKKKTRIASNKYVEITGTVNDEYDKIIGYKKWALENIYTHEAHIENQNAIKNFNDEEYKSFIENREKEINETINSFGKKVDAGKLYYSILLDENYQKALWEKIRYLKFYPLVNEIKIENIQISQYFLNDILIAKQSDNKFCQRRFDFIKELQSIITLSNIDERETLINSWRKKEKATIHNSYYKNQVAHINEVTQGITNDLCLYYFAMRALKSVPSKSQEIHAAVINYIDDDYINKGFNTNFHNELKSNNSQSQVSSKKTIIDSIVNAHPNKVIYVDFWAPWCGPCMQDMPHSKKLKQKINNPDFISVYLAVKCSDNSWKAAVANHDIEGISIKLSDSEYAMLRKKYEINGIPHYLLFDKNGSLVDDHASRPIDRNTFDKIMKLL